MAKSPTPASAIKPDPETQKEVADGVRDEAGGTTQLEPKPEDYPADAKITPGAEQLNTTASQPVGQAAAPTPEAQAVDDSIADAIAEAASTAG